LIAEALPGIQFLGVLPSPWLTLASLVCMYYIYYSCGNC